MIPPFSRNARSARDRAWGPFDAVGLLAAASALLLLAGCLGSGTRRVDASCREMRSAVVYEMLKDNPTMHLLDLRKPSEVTEKEGRLPGALAVPLDQLATQTAAFQSWRENTIIVFGTDGDMGRRGCELLSSRGFRFVIFISDGAIGWFKNRLPSNRSGGSASSTSSTPPEQPAPRRNK